MYIDWIFGLLLINNLFTRIASSLTSSIGSSKERPVQLSWNKAVGVTGDASFNKPYCFICGRRFSVKQSLQRHINTVHTRILFECQHCDLSFSAKTKLDKHVKEVHENIKPFLCGECGFKTFHLLSLSRHTRVLHKEKNDSLQRSILFECTLCGLSFSSIRQRTKHVKEIHDKMKPYLCTECGFKTFHLVSLYRHKRVLHKR